MSCRARHERMIVLRLARHLENLRHSRFRIRADLEFHTPRTCNLHERDLDRSDYGFDTVTRKMTRPLRIRRVTRRELLKCSAGAALACPGLGLAFALSSCAGGSSPSPPPPGLSDDAFLDQVERAIFLYLLGTGEHDDRAGEGSGFRRRQRQSHGVEHRRDGFRVDGSVRRPPARVWRCRAASGSRHGDTHVPARSAPERERLLLSLHRHGDRRTRIEQRGLRPSRWDGRRRTASWRPAGTPTAS